MLKKSLKSIFIVFKYTPVLTVLKIIQVVLASVLAPLSIFFTQMTIDAVSSIVLHGEKSGNLIIWSALLLFSLFFASVGNGFLNGIFYIAIRRKLNVEMTPVILEKFKKLDYQCFEDNDVQDTLNRMSSDPQDKIFNLFLNALGVVECVISFVGSALIFSQANKLFLLGFAFILIPMIILDFKAATIMNDMFNNQSKDERMMYYLGGLLSAKSSLFELKIFRATDYIVNKWRGIANRVMDERVKTTIRSSKYFLLSTILFKVCSISFIVTIVVAVINREISIGVFTALIVATGSIIETSSQLSHGIKNIRERSLLIDHYHKFMSLPEIADGGEKLTNETLSIAFENVSFTYPKTEKQILDAVSFEVKSGERVALVGENGAGKSTIIKLLCRLYKPDSGRITVNGKNIDSLSAQELRRVFSIVFQDYGRYTLTLRENIAFGDITKLNDDKALNQALKMGLADEITELDTPLSKLDESGVDISGGQWQRVAVARACLPESAFVILDEPTAALDPVAESKMYQSFAEVLKNRGCIMISHRLASAKLADKIVVLSDKSVSEIGSHDELMKSGGLYSKMYKTQSAWY